jgi:hypothetical protein
LPTCAPGFIATIKNKQLFTEVILFVEFIARGLFGDIAAYILLPSKACKSAVLS